MDIAELKNIEDRAQLITIGKKLSIPRALAFLDIYAKVSSEQQWKIASVLMGMPAEMFSLLLISASSEQLEILKHEGMKETLLQQLRVLYDSSFIELGELFSKIEDLEKQIAKLKPLEIGLSELSPLEIEIERTREEHLELLEIINKALHLVWNTDRLELIEKLSHLKERIEKSLYLAIGHGRDSDESPNGLYGLLEERLFSVYFDRKNAENPVILENQDPAFDALAKFGAWGLTDYWELGLLPEVEDPALLDQQKSSELESAAFREQTVQEVKQFLSEVGLNTVQDLKDSYIFSKKSLQEYLSL